MSRGGVPERSNGAVFQTGEPMVPPLAPSFTPSSLRLIAGSRQAKPGSAL
jgi:hypothetical protein